MYDFLEKTDNNKSGNLFHILLAPVWFIMEFICYYKIWNKIILPEFITNDELFLFLDNNEFGLKHGRLVKKDLIDDNDFLEGRKLSECKNIIKKEFVETLTDLISKNCTTNIEDLISLIVNTDIKLTKIDGDLVQSKIYEVYIQYCRYWWLQKAKQYAIVWFAVLSIIISLLIYFIK